MFLNSCKSQLSRCVRNFSTSVSRDADFTHAVIGGGVVGLAIARKLAQHEDTSTILIERHGAVGIETSSRNSEVIHAGIYYGVDTLKTKLCLQGKEMMYDLCRENGIPHRNTKKWIVAQNEEQMDALEKVHKHAQSIGVPTRFVSVEEGKQREPDILAQAGILESETTGIVDSHSLMQFLQGSFENSGGDCAFMSPVVKIDVLDNGRSGYRIYTQDESKENSIVVETLVNSAGLFACGINNMIMSEEYYKKPYYAKGSYFSYSLSHPKPSVLVYPAPVPGHGGLGTHLTLDMAGRVRFGPDLEWTDDPNDLSVNSSRLEEAIKDIQSYLPSIKKEAIDLDYAGIRPKLGRLSATGSGAGSQDFYIKKEESREGFINLLGIESPGLTSSLAIGEMVDRLLYG